MRGALTAFMFIWIGAGIIPAYAGSTLLRPSGPPLFRDHPRVCGEHQLFLMGADPDGGSSPRMRGAPVDGGIGFQYVGIIPAYAGSTNPNEMNIGVDADHPRVCGEHDSLHFRCMSRQGSSPRMRGAPFPCGEKMPAGRIIPAYAGSTFLEKYPQG